VCGIAISAYEGKEMQDKMGKFLKVQGAEVVMEHWDQFPECLAAIGESAYIEGNEMREWK
jgi:hypothetical protein